MEALLIRLFRVCVQYLTSLPTALWARLRCDIQSYLCVYFSTDPAGTLQLVGLSNRAVLEGARKRYMPFAAAKRTLCTCPTDTCLFTALMSLYPAPIPIS